MDIYPDAKKAKATSTRHIQIVSVNESNISTKRTGVRLGALNVNVYQTLKDVFMPAGYPHSVSPDYLNYQIYDSLQAFSSAIAGLFASRAVLEATQNYSQLPPSS